MTGTQREDDSQRKWSLKYEESEFALKLNFLTQRVPKIKLRDRGIIFVQLKSWIDS